MNLYLYISVPENLILDFEAGRIDTNTFLERLLSFDKMLLDDMLDVICLTLECYAPDNPNIGLVCEERNVLTDTEGEALLLESCTFEGEEGAICEIADPVGYKTREEIEEAVKFLKEIKEESFLEAFPSEEIGEEFKGYAYEECQRLKTFYESCLERGHLALFIPIVEEDSLLELRENGVAVLDLKREKYGWWLEILAKSVQF